jgi:hypothetical protein
MIHFPNMILDDKVDQKNKPIDRLYMHDALYTICGYFNSRWYRDMTFNHLEVTCGECLNIIRCHHIFEPTNWSRNTMECKICLFQFVTFKPKAFKSGDAVDMILSRLNNKQDLDNLIFSGLKLFGWP